MSDARGRLALSPRTYTWADRVTKLAGVCLVAAGLESGGHTLAGVALGATGVVLALATVFAEPATDSDTDS
ncbi:hypothetical protein G9464_09150 [Halostella sp. JP-L12]|uniref:hypothetical protein n=1 Tax=Halostella TaxID=1843185 RepID=UPI000EF7A648|nr:MULTISPECIES: hypothetical protein [Halostella]NHN47761.1 hypothetical protein [Halostella sp. JP-L12]